MKFAEKFHETLAVISGSFTGSKCIYITAEKEATEILYSVERREYLSMRPENVNLYIDHANLVIIFSPEKAADNFSKSTHKGKQWAITISHFDCTIVHLPGIENVWAEISSRWCPKWDL